MAETPDHSRIDLDAYLINLAMFCKDAKTSYSMLISAINAISQLYANHPRPSRNNPNFHIEFEEFNQRIKYHSSIKRIALHSFISMCAMISKTIWPDTEHSSDLRKRLKVRRKEHLQALFPKTDYPNLTNDFRNFLEHSDEGLDSWDESNGHHNIAFDTFTDKPNLENLTYWPNFDPSSLTVTYYDENEGSKTVGLQTMFHDIEKLHQAIPKAMEKIRNSPPNWHNYLLDL